MRIREIKVVKLNAGMLYERVDGGIWVKSLIFLPTEIKINNLIHKKSKYNIDFPIT